MAKSKKAPPKKKTAAKKPVKEKKAKKDWRDDIKKMLLQMRKELLQEVTQTMRAESDHLKFDIGDFYDHASTDRDRELALMLADREREKLTHVDDALKRIETGTYGKCESCDEDIDKERLAAMPFTKLCLSCQEDLERQ